MGKKRNEYLRPGGECEKKLLNGALHYKEFAENKSKEKLRELFAKTILPLMGYKDIDPRNISIKFDNNIEEYPEIRRFDKKENQLILESANKLKPDAIQAPNPMSPSEK